MAGKKLPRRTMSIAKRGVKMAEAAADLDLVEGAIGKVDMSKVSVFAYGGAWIAAVATLIVVVTLLRLVFAMPFGGAESDFSPDGAQTRYSADYSAFSAEATDGMAATNGDASTLLSVPRSPFPSARQDVPIILEVACPADTVQIATGAKVADTVCIRGTLITDTIAPTPTVTPTIGATPAGTAPTITPTVVIPKSLPSTGSH